MTRRMDHAEVHTQQRHRIAFTHYRCRAFIFGFLWTENLNAGKFFPQSLYATDMIVMVVSQ